MKAELQIDFQEMMENQFILSIHQFQRKVENLNLNQINQNLNQ